MSTGHKYRCGHSCHMDTSSSEEMAASFRRICAVEPRALMLYDEIKKIGDSGGPYSCANELWYSGGDPHTKTRKRSFKERVEELVGWGREAGSKEDSIQAYLRSSTAYDIVYQTLYNALPDCRKCSCIVTGRMIYAELYRRSKRCNSSTALESE
jgi:hypothetical protein